MIRLSTAAKILMLTPWLNALDDMVMRLYSGTMPAAADAAPQGVALGYITQNGLAPNPGHGLHFAMDTTGLILKAPLDVWTLTGIASGVATWGRLSAYNDSPVTNPHALRLDFQVFADGADGDGLGLHISDPTLSAALTRDVTAFNYRIPG
jgi:hypothetical protein